jgi:carboxypeptidase family protein
VKPHSFLALCTCVFVAALESTAAAQLGQTATLSGAVTDTTGASVADVTLTVSSPQLIGGARQTNTRPDGRYRLASLAPGTYEITIAHPGFRTVRHSGVDLLPGFNLTLDLRLEISPLAETVHVTSAAPTIDVHTSSAPTLINREFIDHLPLDRRVIEFVNLAPGVAANTAFGGSLSANPFSLDGTDVNEPGWGSPIATPNANWIDAVQVVALGANAEYGEFTGARTNAITRSGANRFSGLFEYWATSANWTGNNRGSLTSSLAERFRPVEVLELWDTSEQVGGPIVRDRFWFFAGVEYFKYARRPAAFASSPRTDDEPRALTREPKMLVKLTAAPTRSLRLEGYVEYEDTKVTNTNAGPLVRPEALASVQQPAHADNLRLSWPLRDRMLVEARYGGFDWDQTGGPTPPNSREGPPSHFDTFTSVRSVNSQSFSDMDVGTHSVAGTLTRHADRILASSHTFKAGAEHEWAHGTFSSGYPGGASYLDYNGAPDQLILWPGSTYRGSQRRTGIYAQDNWRVHERVTIEPGVRIGLYDGSVPLEGASYQNTAVSLRVGAAWDVARDHRSVIRAHYGRYHDPLVTTFYDFLDPMSQTPTIVMQADSSGQFHELTRFAAATRYGMDPDAKHSFADQYFVGVERQLPARVSVRVHYVRRSFKEALGFIDEGSTWTPVSVTDPGPDGRAGTSDDGGVITVFNNYTPSDQQLVFTNPPGAFRRYNAFQLAGSRAHGRGLHVEAFYTWARTHGSFNNEFSSNAGSNDMGTNGVFVNPNRAINSVGRTSRDVRHDAKVLATYSVPYWGGVRVSLVYRYTSGRPWARIAGFGALTQLAGIRVEPIGSREYPATNIADVRVEKTFRLGQVPTVGLFLNVFNLGNQGIPFNINQMSGSNFGLPLAWIEPRRVRAGVRLVF